MASRSLIFRIFMQFDFKTYAESNELTLSPGRCRLKPERRNADETDEVIHNIINCRWDIYELWQKTGWGRNQNGTG